MNGVQNILQESFFHFDEDLYNNCPDNTDLFGYFQSERYFVDIRDELLEDFTFFLISMVNKGDEGRDW